MKLQNLLLFLAVFALFSAQNIRIQTFTYIPVCKTDNDCLSGYFCNSSLICQDKCINMSCAANSVCKEGECRQTCDSNMPCDNSQICSSGYCIDKCKYINCKSGFSCQLGSCVANFSQCSTDIDCKTGFYCSKDFKCIDKCSIKNYCTPGQVCKNGQCKTVKIGCVDSFCPQIFNCSNVRPNENTCPTLYFIKKPDPIVCGVTQNGSLIDYPVQCYACKDNTIVYYFNVTCDKVPKNCTNNNIGNLCSDQIKCSNPRPDENSCPNITWIKQPDSLVCGVTKLGQYVDFPVECQACKQKNIVFYYNKTCVQVRLKATTLTCSQVSCQVGLLCQDGKCIDPPSTNLIDCSSPRPTQINCPFIYFVKKPDPIVCGLTKTGQLINFRVLCYACKSTRIMAYYNTTCDQVNEVKCLGVNCTDDEICINGECIIKKWPVCLKDVKQQQCSQNRPTQQTCPLIYFFFPPSNIVCGITQTGQRISYPVECYACKNTDVIYYYNKSCEELSLPCEYSLSCVNSSASNNNPLNTTLINNSSVNSNPVNNTPECTIDSDCASGLSCQDKHCIDKCFATTCPLGTNCSKGECIKIVNTQINRCQNIKCIQGFKCQNGQCVDLCKDVQCPITDSCVLGICVRLLLTECFNIKCRPGYKCQNGQCIDKCKNNYCTPTQTCINGGCVPLLY